MNCESITKRLRPGIRLGISAAVIAGLSVLGAAALDAGAAGASTTGGSGEVPSCSSALSLSTNYSYTSTATGEVTGLSDSGCSTSSNPVTITLSEGRVSRLLETVTPSCVAGAPHDCLLFPSFSIPNSELWLTAADAETYGPPATSKETSPYQFEVQFVAKQPATGASYTLSFWLWIMD